MFEFFGCLMVEAVNDLLNNSNLLNLTDNDYYEARIKKRDILDSLSREDGPSCLDNVANFEDASPINTVERSYRNKRR